MPHPNPVMNVLPNRVWRLLLEYVEHSSCFKSGNWPDSGLRFQKKVSRKGNVVFVEEGPFLCLESGTTPREGFGVRECDEVALCWIGLDVRLRMLIEATIAGVVLGKPTMWMRAACRKLGIGKVYGYRLRRVAFEKLAMACEEKGIS